MTKVPTPALRTLDMLKKLEMQENRITAIQEGDFEGTSTFVSAFPAIPQLSSGFPLGRLTLTRHVRLELLALQRS